MGVSVSILRLTGVVVSVDHKAGTSSSGTAYAFDVLRVMVPQTDFVEVTFNRGVAPSVGESFDALVRVSATKTGRLRVDYFSPVPADVSDLA